MQRTALRAAADAERWPDATERLRRFGSLSEVLSTRYGDEHEPERTRNEAEGGGCTSAPSPTAPLVLLLLAAWVRRR